MSVHDQERIDVQLQPNSNQPELQETSPSETSPRPSPTIDKYSCQTCGREFKSHMDLRIHYIQIIQKKCKPKFSSKTGPEGLKILVDNGGMADGVTITASVPPTQPGPRFGPISIRPNSYNNTAHGPKFTVPVPIRFHSYIDVYKSVPPNVDGRKPVDELTEKKYKRIKTPKSSKTSSYSRAAIASPDIIVNEISQTSRTSLEELSQSDPLDTSLSVGLTDGNNFLESFPVKLDPDSSLFESEFSEEMVPYVGNSSDSHMAVWPVSIFPSVIPTTALEMDPLEMDSSFSRGSSIVANEGDITKTQSITEGTSHHTCPVCNKRLKTALTLSSHMDLHSQNRIMYSCTICDRPFKHLSVRQQHENTHMSLEELVSFKIFFRQCKECLRIFFQQRNYEAHLNTHRNIKPFICLDCQKSYASKLGLKKHMLRRHGDEATKINRELRKIECPIPNCFKKFSSKSALQKHRRSHGTKKDFKCKFCDKCFRSPRTRDGHSKIHDQDPALKCYFCQRYFSHLWIMENHMKCHLLEFEFKCQICGKGFVQKHYLNDHVARVHEGYKNPRQTCQHCHKSFGKRSYLAQHMLKYCKVISAQSN